MRSKTSKSSQRSRSRKKGARACSEAEVRAQAKKLASRLKPGSRVFLEGPLGAGKTTFAQAVIQALGAQRPTAGSPTFPIMHLYESKKGRVAHIDLYRLGASEDWHHSGVEEEFWNPSTIVLCEWLSLWPEIMDSVSSRPHWRVELEIPSAEESRHDTSRIRLVKIREFRRRSGQRSRGKKSSG